MLLLLWLAGCSTSAPTEPEVTVDCASAGSCEDPCRPVEALFFDLGGTLVIYGTGELLETRPGAADLLDDLRGLGLPLGVITDVPPGYDRQDLGDLLAEPSLLDRFDVVLMSSEAEAGPKPDPAIFVEAVGLLADPPPVAHTAFVTEEIDHLADARVPTVGAQAAGMIGVHLSDDPPSRRVDHTVPTAELTSIATASWLTCPSGS